MRPAETGFILLFAFLICTGAAAQEGRRLDSGETGQLFDTLYNRLAGVETMTVDFTQTRELPMFEDKLVSEGICYFQAPESLRWEYILPFRTLLIYRDGRAAKFDIIDGNLRRIPQPDDLIAAVMGEILDWMKGDFEASAEQYDIAVYELPDTWTLVFTPKSEDFAEFISAITLVFDRETAFIRTVTLTGAMEDTLVLAFSNQVNNRSLDSRLFDPVSPSLP
jgi:outer membrane lipoprotein-sorting protein